MARDRSKDKGRDREGDSSTEKGEEDMPPISPEEMKEPETVPPKRKTELEEAQEALWRLHLQAGAMLADVSRLLKGPLAGKVRKAADKLAIPFGGDAKTWKPLQLVYAFLKLTGGFDTAATPGTMPVAPVDPSQT